MGKFTGIIGVPWHTCGKCGTDVRVTELVLQRGIYVCRRCVDSQKAERRIRDIQRVLDTIEQEPANWTDLFPTVEISEEQL